VNNFIFRIRPLGKRLRRSNAALDNSDNSGKMTLSAPRSLGTIAPTEEDSALAQASSQILASYVSSDESHYTIRVLPDGTTGEAVTIPRAAFSLLVDILIQMASGNAVSIVPIKKELTTSEAADILNVSRPYLVDLLESGKIAFRKVGTRRRVLYQDLMEYKNRIDAERRQTLAELTAQAQELNMGYE
jgi:excisionase family DNA binding protein